MDSGPLIRTGDSLTREPQNNFQAEFQRQLAPNVYSALPAQESMMRDYFRVLVKRRWVVLATIALIFGVVAIATLRAPRIYDAAGSIAINKPDTFLLNFKDGGGGELP